jgi:hypothetical protein
MLAGVAVALAIATGVATMVAEATAKKVTLKTRIELENVQLNSAGQYEVTGKVLAKSPACRFRRVASLHVLHPDNTDTIADVQMTKSGVGLFTVRAALSPGEGLFVTVAARNLTIKSGKRLHCATGRTTPIFPPSP